MGDQTQPNKIDSNSIIITEAYKNSSNIFAAFAKAQHDFAPIEKNSKVEVYSKPPERKFLYEYYYADLTEIINKTRPALSKHGLSFTQGMGKEGFYTRIMHSSGEYFDSGLINTEIKASDYKEMGGATTYLKRISLSAALGISADEDVDAAESEAKQGNSTQRQETKGGYVPKKSLSKPPPSPLTPKQKLVALVNNFKIPYGDVPELIYRCTGSTDLTSDTITEEQYTIIEQYVKMTKDHRSQPPEFPEEF